MFFFHKWLELPINTRHAIAGNFGIIKRGSTEVVADVIKSDGYLIKEIEEALNVEALQNYLNTTEKDMSLLWTWLIEKTEGRELTMPNLDTTANEPKTVNDLINIVPIKPKRGRPSKKNV